MTPRAIAHIATACALAACGGGRSGLKLTLIDASVQRPSNVAVYFTVDTADGDPVAGLTADAFTILEDEKPISELESKKTILNPEVAAAHYTLLLIDMSGSVTESGDLPTVVQSAQAFGERVQQYQKVGVYAFDGSPNIEPIAPFTSGKDLAAGMARLGTFKARDPSTNLNGAVLEAMKALEHQMTSSSQPLTFGTLVVFTDGTDHAHRVTREALHQSLDQTRIDVLVIGVGKEIDEGELRAIGKKGAILSKDRAQIAKSFDQAAARVEAYSKRYYLLGYCSPSRAGTHDVEIQAHAGGKGGELGYHFDANGFGTPCDPTRQPSFNVKRPRTPPAEGGPHNAGKGHHGEPAPPPVEAGKHF